MYDIGNKPAEVALTIVSGDSWSRAPTLTGIDLTGASMRGQLRKTVGGATVAPITCTITDATAGELLWTLDVPAGIGGCNAKDPAAQYVGEIELVDSLGEVRTLVRMAVTVLSEVARAT